LIDPRPGALGDARRLTAGIARGDRAALDEFYRAWFGWSYTMARTLTRRDEAFCLDVVQEAMLRVVRSVRPMRTRHDLERWMTRVLHTTALDLLRGESRREARERRAVAGAMVAAAPDAAAVLAEQIRWVRARLAELPAAEGWLVWLRLGRGRTLDQAGEAAGISGDAAHGRVRRVTARIRGVAREGGHE
jgi:RNA polymerase sigma-70 factor, ECF subfamily